MRTYLTIIITQTVSIIGSQMSGFAIGIQIFAKTGQATPLALVGFFQLVPRIIGNLAAGVISDRYDRRTILLIGDTGQAATTLLLLISFATGSFQLWHLYSLVAIAGAFSVLQEPAFAATITMLVPDEKRDLANTLQQMSQPAAGIVAPVLATLLYVLIDITGVLVIDLLSFGVAVTALYFAHIPRPTVTAEGAAAQGSILKEALTGFRFLWQRRPLFYVMLFAMSINFMFNMVGILRTPYVMTLTNSETTLGIIAGLMAAGPLLGGVAFTMWKRKPSRVHVIMRAIIVMGVMVVGYGVARHPILLGFFAFTMLLTNPAANASFFSLLQVKTPPDMQGRVFAAVMQLAMLATPLAFLIVGPLTDRVLEPAVGGAGWNVVAPLVGNQAGAGMGLLTVVAGAMVTVMAVLMYRWPLVLNLEESLPDFRAPQQDEPAAPHPVPEPLPVREPVAIEAL